MPNDDDDDDDAGRGHLPDDDRGHLPDEGRGRRPDHGREPARRGVGSPGSSPRYQDGTAGYSGAEEPARTQPEGNPPADADADADADGREFWKPLGFDTRADYMRYLRRMQSLYEPLPRGAQPPAPRIAGAEVADVEPEAMLAREMRSRQVNVKLRPREGTDLDRAARIYGLAPSTLARLLVKRGVQAILDEC